MHTKLIDFNYLPSLQFNHISNDTNKLKHIIGLYANFVGAMSGISENIIKYTMIHYLFTDWLPSMNKQVRPLWWAQPPATPSGRGPSCLGEEGSPWVWAVKLSMFKSKKALINVNAVKKN